jgi:4-carboxymuconolactone decarboxylase
MYDALLAPDSRSIRGLRGPAGILLHSPELAKLTKPYGHYLRFETGFTGRVRELVILVTARCCDSQFEWSAHEKEALKEGVPKETIELVRLGRSLETVEAVDSVIIQLVRETFLARKVSFKTYRQALEVLGTRGLVDLAALMGHYASTAAMLKIFNMQLDEGVEPPLPAL